MPVKINVAAFKSISFHSDALSVLSSIAHPCAKAGEFMGRILQGRRVVGGFRLTVSDTVSSTQTNIDLSGLEEAGLGRLRSGKTPHFSVKTGGYVQFYVSTGMGQFGVDLRLADAGEGGRATYSTRTLQKGDVFGVILMRPGNFTVTDKKSGKNASYTVLEAVAQKAFLEGGPLPVKCTKNGFDPNKAEVMSGKGVVFLVEDGPSVIYVDQAKDELGRKVNKGLVEKSFTTPRWARPMRASDMK